MKHRTRTHSHYTIDAVQLLGHLIRLKRKENKWTAQETSERAGISRGTLHRIEKGDLKCEIGIVFELATIVGLKLFDMDKATLPKHINQVEDKLTLLPKSVRKQKRNIDDDF